MMTSAGPPRAPALSAEAMVVANHHAVSSAGFTVLRAGGNAIDATLAMAAISWLVLPGQCGVGGDAFAVVREPDGRVWTVGGSGYGPDGATPNFYREQAFAAIPLSGPLAVAAPGAIAAIAAMHGRGATLSLEQLWAPAITAAGRGIACTAKTRADILDHEPQLRVDDGTASMFLRNGRAPEIGQRLTYPDLAGSMRTLAHEPSSLYTGTLAEQAVAALVASGAPFSGEEWAATGQALVGPAITGRYGSLAVHVTPPPSPGWMLLQQAALCEGALAGMPWLDAEAVNLLACAARQAFRDRWELCGSDTEAWRALLQPAAIASTRAQLTRPELSAFDAAADGDTTSTVVVDHDGRAVSFIQSLALTFGAHVTVPGTGIVLNNRLGRGSYLADGHPNEVRPRRRPLHTLNAWLATDDRNRLVHIGNTPGGDGQVQWNMQVLSHLVDHGLDPQEAVSAPRFSVYPGSDANTIGEPDELICESRLSAEVVATLASRGHRIRSVGPWQGGGGALAVSIDHRLGYLSGGADPRQEGVALGV